MRSILSNVIDKLTFILNNKLSKPRKRIAIGNNDFKFKLIFPCMFEYNNPYPYSYYPYSYYPTHCLPYGMGVITAFLRQHNYYVEQEDLSIRFNRHNVFLTSIFKNIDLDILRNAKVIRRFLESGDIKGNLSLYIDKILDSSSIEGFDAIGFSIFSYFYFIFALMLSKRIKQRTDIPIVFGGSFISFYGHLYPEIFDFIDYMIVGDGRIPLLKLIDYLKKKIAISEVPSLIYRDNGNLMTTSKEEYPIEDIPMPDFINLPLGSYENRYSDFSGNNILLPYQISRGCTQKCKFCNNRYINDKLEFKSYEKVLSELRQMNKKYKSRMFRFCDDAINNSYKYLEGLCDIFIKHKLNVNWSVYAKVGNLDKYILRKMKEAGCQWLLFGIESGSDRILRMMNKGFTSEQASQALKDAHEAGLSNCIFLIAGYPHETQEDIEQTADFIKKNKNYIYRISIHKFYLEYGSLIYYNPESYGIENLKSAPLGPYFTFDEIGGLKWEQKQKQQAYSERQIIKVVYKNARFNRKLSIILYFYYFVLRYYLGILLLKLKEYSLK